ncbi:hypothetical protein ATSB10_23830 [Dyella thiooxydans]|uniref:Lipoprotein n=1 Tax=Dyella thiooxydans TaxID=445710 RepID=A0A160N2K8_9GAMM|nr:hypothetical protein [Dyella thiooxydans]AND69837.1 hypothetical protein ATSB10_23830 [Dyella thiooxydans]
MRNHHAKQLMAAVLLTLAAGACTGRAATPGTLDDAALLAYAKQPWDKATLMHTTVPLGRYHGVPVVAEFPCGDVCPQYTQRIIHFDLPEGADCASIGGVEREVLVPMAITMRTKRFCFPKVLVDAGLHAVR